MKIKRMKTGPDEYTIVVKDGQAQTGQLGKVVLEWKVTGTDIRIGRMSRRVWKYRNEDGEERASDSLRDIEHAALSRALLKKATAEVQPA